MTTSPPISAADRDTARDCILYVEKHPEMRTILHRFCEAYEARVVELEAALKTKDERIAFLEETQIQMVSTGDALAVAAEASDARATALLEALTEARLQIEYLHGKFGETGSGNGVLAKIDHALAAQQDRQTEESTNV